MNGVVGGSPSTGTITTDGLYTAPNTPIPQAILIGVRNQSAQSTVSIYDPTHPPAGSVTTTQNPLVVSYTLAIPASASAQVQFGTDTSYGLFTSAVPSTTGGSITILVAGMRASTTYHMQAVTTLADGTQLKDADHTFSTGAIPASLPNITTELTGVGTPSPGIELLSLTLNGPQTALTAVATDLAGNVIWYYDLPTGAYPFPIKLLPNGHMLLVTAGTLDDIREIDLAGNIIHEVTLNTINQSLAQSLTWGIAELNHDMLMLPNGHLILLANVAQSVSNVPGVPAGTEVTGNALIDWDLQLGQAVWTWSTFDHLALTHAPYGISDWTHGNALAYSPDDGNLLFSMRNQNWVVKINYQDGEGDGSILWRFGPGGDFTLPNGQAPIEWNYGQHYVTIQSPNSSGIFNLMLFNNGNNRLVDANNDVCGTPGFIACYSSVPIFQLNEYNKTASVLWEDKLDPAYSVCCGDALVLPNGDVEFDVALDVNSPNLSYIEEVAQTEAPELIWRMNVQGQLSYRGFRIPSLYPGVTWPANTTQSASVASAHH
ncbi:MAG TPA: aryl-sulfate sulfotransferase [Candidatus Eremiobacteraceae bacterium]|nr:aryl-sulfate sulfotransferase [Candidatus Eremiobacteraceae bacterium]